MFNHDSQEKAEKKLILLHVARRFDFPLTNVQLTDFVISLDLMDYFTLQQYLDELVAGGMLEYSKSDDGFFYLITPKGGDSLDYFEGRLPSGLISLLDEAVEKHKKGLSKHTQVLCDYSKKGESEYVVSLRILENEIVLMNLELSVVSNRQAKEICQRWRENSTQVYTTLIELLTGS